MTITVTGSREPKRTEYKWESKINPDHIDWFVDTLMTLGSIPKSCGVVGLVVFNTKTQEGAFVTPYSDFDGVEFADMFLDAMSDIDKLRVQALWGGNVNPSDKPDPLGR